MAGANGQPGTQATRRALAAHAAEQEAGIASVIGQAVALHLADLLKQMAWQPGCVLCTARAKQALAAHATKAAAAQAAGEEIPIAPDPAVMPALTWVPLGSPPVALPVCFGCFAPPPDIRQVGLVDAAGNPITKRVG